MWGLLRIKTTVLNVMRSIQEYICKMVPKDELLREYLHL